MFTQKSISRILTVLLVAMVLQMVIVPVRPAFAAATFNVNSALDEIDDDTSDGVCHTAANTCTLRAAIMQANKMTGPGVTINLPAGTYTLTRPSAGANGDDNGDLNLTTPVSGNPVITINGAGAGTTIIDANQIDRVLSIATGRTASITGVTLRNGYITGSNGGGIYNSGTLTVTNSTLSGNSASFATGGGIYNASSGTLTVTNSMLSGNSASSGSGIYNKGSLTVTNSTISQNNANSEGGGIYNDTLGTLTVTNSTLSGNSSAYYGGGIFNFGGTLTVTNSTINQNNAGSDGGGVYNAGALILVNSTISQNNANGYGGGIYNNNTANIYNTTIYANGADADVDFNGNGGGVYIYPGSTFAMRNTMVAGNNLSDAPVYEDCYGELYSYGQNLLWDVTGCTVYTMSGSWMLLNSLSNIGPLKNNGGPTMTHALLPGSNAIDGGDPDLGCVDSNLIALATDQRGAARVSGAFCDIGAYEYVPPVTLQSNGSNDGWILESSETSAAGGTLNASATTFNLGDNAQDKQYRAILHFDTSSLPDTAVITKVTLKIRKQGLVGTDPFTILGLLRVDMRKPSFGAVALALADFQATAGKTSVAAFGITPVSNWYSAVLNGAGRNYINKTGTTQFRLRFATDDNNDNGADTMKFFSGDYATASVRPTLIIEYYVP